MAVDFLEDKAQHGGVDEGLGLFLYFLGALTGEVVGIEKFQKIAERRKFRIAWFLAVFEHRTAEQRKFAIIKTAYADGLALQRANFEQ